MTPAQWRFTGHLLLMAFTISFAACLVIIGHFWNTGERGPAVSFGIVGGVLFYLIAQVATTLFKTRNRWK